jgi:hypothetical protein
MCNQLHFTPFSLKAPLFNKKSPSAKAKGLKISWLPRARQNDFRTFFMNEETEEIYQKLEEVINV